jgi:isoamylase
MVTRPHRNVVLLDPYARAVTGGERWGERRVASPRDTRPHPARGRRCLVVDDTFDWEFDQPLDRPLAGSVIYEVHVRGFTGHASSSVRHPGTFAGLVEKIPYLTALGVTAVELLPAVEFEETQLDRVDPLTGARLLNYWGYDSVAFFAPKAGYAAEPRDGGAVREFKAMVKALHRAGIEVILDVVFNHTAESDERGPTWSFRGIDNATYYILDADTGRYHNYTGCGNTVNCNHPVVRDLVLDCLRYWVTEMHVDGFRFDLASVLGRGRDGEVLANPPLLERIAADPVLARTKLIAEAWDAAGLYQVGTFPAWGHWAEWNGRFRDDVRRFVKSDPGLVGALATRLAGSADLYQASGRSPAHSINFVTCHDGFTLADLVTYGGKHNDANGEGGADGGDDNLSWNCGVEGPTDDDAVTVLRRRQARNLLAILLCAHGTPMLLAGDEIGRSQAGNNNAYCQDGETSWVDWRDVERRADLLRFVRLLIAFRMRHPCLRREAFEPAQTDGVIRWHGLEPDAPDWSWESRTLGMHVSGGADGDVLVLINAHWESRDVRLPALDAPRRWHRVVDTSRESPHDVEEDETACPLDAAALYRVAPRTVVVLVGTVGSESGAVGRLDGEEP